MELVQEMTIKSNKGITEKTELFQKINGVIFCKECGKEYKESNVAANLECTICGCVDFIKGEFAASLAGYIRLDKIGKLKEYYKLRTKKVSGARMNTRRTVVWLLVKDGFIVPGDKKAEDSIYRTLWKKW